MEEPQSRPAESFLTERRAVPLKFWLGEIPLFTVSIPAVVLQTHFTQSAGAVPGTEEVSKWLSPGAEVALFKTLPVQEELPALTMLPGLIRYVRAQYRNFYVDLRGTFEEYLNKFSSKSRSTLQRKVRKATQLSGGTLEWKAYRQPDEIRNCYELAREVSRKTYQERLLDAGLPESQEYLQEMVELAERGSVRGYVLSHQKQPIAFLLCPAREGILSYAHVGYDPAFGDWSPGTVLMYQALNDLFSEGKFRMLDFTQGEGAHKEFFSTGSVHCADIYYFRRTFKNLLLVRFHYFLSNTSKAIVRLLDRTGLKSRIKKLLRSKA